MRRRLAAHCPQGIISRWKDQEYEQRLAAGIPDAHLAPAPTTADASSSSSDHVEEEEEEESLFKRQAHDVAKGGQHEYEHAADKADKANTLATRKGLSVDAVQQNTAEDQEDQLQDSSDVA